MVACWYWIFLWWLFARSDWLRGSLWAAQSTSSLSKPQHPLAAWLNILIESPYKDSTLAGRIDLEPSQGTASGSTDHLNSVRVRVRFGWSAFTTKTGSFLVGRPGKSRKKTREISKTCGGILGTGCLSGIREQVNAPHGVREVHPPHAGDTCQAHVNLTNSFGWIMLLDRTGHHIRNRK